MLNVFKRYRRAKENFLSLSPKGKWHYVRKIAASILHLAGIHSIDPIFKIYWLSYVPGVTVFFGSISFPFTIWYYFDTSPLKGFLFLPTYAIIVPSTILYLMVMIPGPRKKFRALFFFFGDKIYTDFNANRHPKYTRAIDKSAVELMINTTKTTAIIIFSMIIYLIFPVVVYFRSNELHLPIPILMPFTNLETKNGIIINLCNQSSIAIMIVIGNIAIEMITCMLKNSVWAITVATCHTIDEISELTTNSVTVEEKKFDCYIRNLSDQVRDLDRFIRDLSDLYYWKFFTQPIMLTFGVSLALFFHLYGVWKCGLGISLLFYTQLYILCDIGNLVDSANKMLLQKINEMPWHLLSRKNQLAYSLILMRLQNGAILRMGPFDKLDFVTLTDMTKLVYSVLMMLLRILK